MKIRNATLNDIKAMDAIAYPYWDDYQQWINEEYLASMINANSEICWVVEDNGIVVGFRACKDDSENRIWDGLICIRKDWQQKGIGSKLFKETNKILKKKGYRCVYSECYSENTASIRYQLKCGRKILCTMPKFYADDSDAILFYFEL